MKAIQKAIQRIKRIHPQFNASDFQSASTENQIKVLSALKERMRQERDELASNVDAMRRDRQLTPADYEMESKNLRWADENQQIFGDAIAELQAENSKPANDVMSRAWKIRRDAAARFGVPVMDVCFQTCMILAWQGYEIVNVIESDDVMTYVLLKTQTQYRIISWVNIDGNELFPQHEEGWFDNLREAVEAFDQISR